MDKYRSGRRAARVAIVSGWIMAAVSGLLLAMVIMLELIVAFGMHRPLVSLDVGFPIGVAMTGLGLLLVLAGWMARAVFDMADSARAGKRADRASDPLG